jgi:hypothetical protein
LVRWSMPGMNFSAPSELPLVERRIAPSSNLPCF